MNEFAEQYNTLYRCQFEFRKNHSTSHALIIIHLMKRISSAIDQRETTVGVFLDLSKGALWYPWCGSAVEKKLLFLPSAIRPD